MKGFLRTHFKHVTICQEHTGIHIHTHTHKGKKYECLSKEKNRKDNDNDTNVNMVLTCCPHIIIEQ